MNELEEEQEYLSHEATDVAKILEKRSFDGNWKDEWSKESKEVESHYQVEECFSLDKLIVHKFLNWFKFVELKSFVTFFAKQTSQMLVSELNSVVFTLLNSTYFLSDDELLEVDETVLNFVTFPLHFLHIGLNAVYIPCHEGVSQDYFAEKFLLRVVVVNEGLHHVITDFFRCEWR